MELQQLRAFVCAVDYGSFRRAADELSVSQAAISHSIKSLEGRVAVTLLVRSARGLSLTEAGEVLLPYARRVLESVDAASEDLAALREKGTLRLATFASASSHYLPTVMTAFHARFPRVRLDIQEGNDLEALEWLRNGDADVAFVVDGAADVDFQPIYDDDFVLVAPRGELSCEPGGEVPITALEGTSMVAATGGCERVVSASLKASGVTVSYSATARETSTALALVQAGVGVTVLPRLLISTMPDGLVCFDVVPRISRKIGVAVRKGERRAHAVASFLSFVARMKNVDVEDPRASAPVLSPRFTA